MLTNPNEQLYEIMENDSELRKKLFSSYRKGEKEIANEVIVSLGIETTIDSFMEYLAKL